MQNTPSLYKNRFYWQMLTAEHLILALMFLCWFVPVTKVLITNLDNSIFGLLNKSLLSSRPWMYFWGYLNHPHETWLNLVCMLAINILIIFLSPTKNDKIKTTLSIIYFWVFFQLGLLVMHGIFKDLLHINRLSPTVLSEPWLKLSVMLNNPGIKDSSHNSFPAGHTFVAIYWVGFTLMLTHNKYLKIFTILIGGLLILPRLFSGAHWFSDILVTAVLSLIWLTWSLIIFNNRRNKLCLQ